MAFPALAGPAILQGVMRASTLLGYSLGSPPPHALKSGMEQSEFLRSVPPFGQ